MIFIFGPMSWLVASNSVYNLSFSCIILYQWQYSCIFSFLSQLLFLPLPFFLFVSHFTTVPQLRTSSQPRRYLQTSAASMCCLFFIYFNICLLYYEVVTHHCCEPPRQRFYRVEISFFATDNQE